MLPHFLQGKKPIVLNSIIISHILFLSWKYICLNFTVCTNSSKGPFSSNLRLWKNCLLSCGPVQTLFTAIPSFLTSFPPVAAKFEFLWSTRLLSIWEASRTQWEILKRIKNKGSITSSNLQWQWFIARIGLFSNNQLFSFALQETKDIYFGAIYSKNQIKMVTNTGLKHSFLLYQHSLLSSYS